MMMNSRSAGFPKRALWWCGENQLVLLSCARQV